MANITKLATDARGNYRRDIGWKREVFSGRYCQHRFYLGRDRNLATIRALALERLWAAVETVWGRERRLMLEIEKENGWQSERPVWDLYSLAVGMAVSRGDETVEIDPHADEEISSFAHDADMLANWFGRLQRDFGGCGVRLVLAGAEAQQTYQDGLRRREEEAARLDIRSKRLRRQPTGQTLHQAFDSYSEWARRHYAGSAYGTVVLKEIDLLKRHRTDTPLPTFGLTEIDGLLDYWRQRPLSKYGRPVSVASAANQIKRIRHFVRWLHKTPSFDWRRPYDYEVTPVRIVETPAEVSARFSPAQVETYSVEQLHTLWEYATPLQRAYMMLGLNCGFGAAEVATLQLAEIQGEYIRRVRFKSRVYGEWRLWPETRAAIEYIRANRPQTDAGELIVAPDGTSIHGTTEGGNRNQKIPNAWDRLHYRLVKDIPAFPKLSFNKLRKTAGDLVRQVSEGETASVFLCHGQATRDDLLDSYTNRDFSKVFAATDKVYEQLTPGFTRVAVPFPTDVRHPVLSIGTIRQIQALRAAGMRTSDIAKKLGVSRETVRRYTLMATS